jgi:membrane protein YdbS with pleckstrin-like domain
MSLARVVTVMSALAIALLIATNYCWAAAELDPENDVISFRRGFLWVTHYVIPRGSVYFVASHQASLSSRLSVATVCIGVYDSRAVRLWVPVGRPGLLDQFVEGAQTR